METSKWKKSSTVLFYLYDPTAQVQSIPPENNGFRGIKNKQQNKEMILLLTWTVTVNSANELQRDSLA
jgi:hypothetical protein